MTTKNLGHFKSFEQRVDGSSAERMDSNRDNQNEQTGYISPIQRNSSEPEHYDLPIGDDTKKISEQLILKPLKKEENDNLEISGHLADVNLND